MWAISRGEGERIQQGTPWSRWMQRNTEAHRNVVRLRGLQPPRSGEQWPRQLQLAAGPFAACFAAWARGGTASAREGYRPPHWDHWVRHYCSVLQRSGVQAQDINRGRGGDYIIPHERERFFAMPATGAGVYGHLQQVTQRWSRDRPSFSALLLPPPRATQDNDQRQTWAAYVALGIADTRRRQDGGNMFLYLPLLHRAGGRLQGDAQLRCQPPQHWAA